MTEDSDGTGWDAPTRRQILSTAVAALGLSALTGEASAQTASGAACTWLGDQSAAGYGVYELGLANYQQRSQPSTPDSGTTTLYVNSSGDVVALQPDGSTSTLGGSGGTDTRVNIEEDGSQIQADATAINFAAGLTASDDGDDSVSVSSGLELADVSEEGTTTVSDVSDINYRRGATVTDDGDGTVSVDGLDTLGLPSHHTNYGSGLSTEEIARFSLAAGEVLEVYRLEAALKGGGTNANVTLDIYDATAATQLASVSGGAVSQSSPSPLGSSGPGNTILVRISTGGSAVDLCPSGYVEVVG